MVSMPWCKLLEMNVAHVCLSEEVDCLDPSLSATCSSSPSHT